MSGESRVLSRASDCDGNVIGDLQNLEEHRGLRRDGPAACLLREIDDFETPAERRGGATVAKLAQDFRIGLRSMISGLFFVRDWLALAAGCWHSAALGHTFGHSGDPAGPDCLNGFAPRGRPLSAARATC